MPSSPRTPFQVKFAFREQVTTRTLTLRSVDDGRQPAIIKMYANNPHLDFNDVTGGAKAIQTVELSEDDWATGRFNHGRADVKSIVACLSSAIKIQILTLSFLCYQNSNPHLYFFVTFLILTAGAGHTQTTITLAPKFRQMTAFAVFVESNLDDEDTTVLTKIVLSGLLSNAPMEGTRMDKKNNPFNADRPM
jgi:hypothetical protein